MKLDALPKIKGSTHRHKILGRGRGTGHGKTSGRGHKGMKARSGGGPEWAGADPGPAGSRRGGPLTVTDCNLFLGRIDPAYFPAVFGPGGDEPLDPEAARARLEEVAAALPEPTSLDAIAEGFLAIAVHNMAGAIRKISVARGHDVTTYALACFGGAGGQHACRVADALGLEPEGLVSVHQVHSPDVVTVTAPLADRPRADAMVTATPGLALAVLTADCQPVLFADAKARVIEQLQQDRVPVQVIERIEARMGG